MTYRPGDTIRRVGPLRGSSDRCAADRAAHPSCRRDERIGRWLSSCRSCRTPSSSPPRWDEPGSVRGRQPRAQSRRDPTRVLVIGATGGTGRELVTQALERGYSVTALVRNPSRLQVDPPRLTVVQGDVLDRARSRRRRAVRKPCSAPSATSGTTLPLASSRKEPETFSTPWRHTASGVSSARPHWASATAPVAWVSTTRSSSSR